MSLVSHKCKIIELYLQMYTETEIVDRSGHSYESIEAYLKEFSRVVTLADRGLNAVMIRQVTGRSMALVNAYLDLYRKYDRDPDYVFRLEHIKRNFTKDEEEVNQQQEPDEKGKSQKADETKANQKRIVGVSESKKKPFSLIIPTEIGPEKP